MPARFANDLFKDEVGAKLNAGADQNVQDAWQMARSAIENFGLKDIYAMKGRMAASSRSGGSSGRSGFNWGGALGGLAEGVGGLLGGMGGGSKLPGFNIKDPVYSYNPSGIDFSSGWR